MRSILDRATITATPAAPAPAEKPKYVPKPFKKAEEAAPVEEPVIEEVVAPVQPTATVPAANAVQEEAPAPAEEKKPSKSKSHIGNMFDLLTFSDV